MSDGMALGVCIMLGAIALAIAALALQVRGCPW